LFLVYAIMHFIYLPLMLVSCLIYYTFSDWFSRWSRWWKWWPLLAS